MSSKRLALAVFMSSAIGGGYLVGTELTNETRDPRLESLSATAPRLKKAVLRSALHAAETAWRSGLANRQDVLAIIDYSVPSTEPRLWIFDLRESKLLFEELVSHGKNSGDNQTVRFSNVPESLMSSVGTFVTADTYDGKNGYSLRLQGLEPGFNDKAMARAIVMHGADYVSDGFARKHGRLGRSWGCPAVRRAVARPIIDTLAGGAVLFSYYPQREWLSASTFLHRDATLAD